MDQDLPTVVQTSWCSVTLSLLGAGLATLFAFYTMIKSRPILNMVIDSDQQSDEVPVSEYVFFR